MDMDKMYQLPKGTRIRNRYEIEDVIGQGGFGITYRGFDLTLEVPVAIKEYYPSGIASRYHTQSLDVQTGGADNTRIFAEGKEKFLEEARILAKASYDPNVVSVRDFFEENCTAYIVMQYLEGESLEEYVKSSGAMPFDEAFVMLRPVMRSLGYLHDKGLIHRDITPSNLMRVRGGNIKLIDFGTTREISAEGERSLSVMLKPGFAPPEQYQTRGRQGPWTDVYGICASIYKMITEKTPENAIDRLIDDDLMPPSECGAVITPAEERALLRGMAVDYKQRFQNMKELEDALEAATEEKDLPEESDDEDFDEERTVMGPAVQILPEYGKSHELPVYNQKSATADNVQETPEPDKVREMPEKRNVRETPEQKKSQRKEESSGKNRKKDEPSGKNQKEDETSNRNLKNDQKSKKNRNKNQRSTKREKASHVTDLDGREQGTPGRQKKGSRKWLLLIGIAAAAVIIIAVFLFRPGGAVSSSENAGGEVYEYTDGTQKVTIGKYGETTVVTTSMLDELDSNEKAVAISFQHCELSDEVITRLGSMKRIKSLDFTDCTGFSTLSPLSELAALEELNLRASTSSSASKEETTINGQKLFTSDIPQLTTFRLYDYTLEGGLSFLARFTGLDYLLLGSVELGETSDILPELPAVTTVKIDSVDLSGVDVSALGKAENLKTISLNEDHLTDLTFLSGAAALYDFSAEDNFLTSLDGLQGKENLKYVYVSDNKLNDISALESAPALLAFHANNNQIEDISVLSGCTKLNSLYLKKNRISDAAALSACTELITLNIAGNQLEDLTPIGTCTDMQYLDISGNSISSLSFCENMLELVSLRASSNEISDLAGLSNVTQLKRVFLDSNQISDISVLGKNEDHLELAVLDNNQVSDLSAFKSCTNLAGLSVSNNQLTTLSGLEDCAVLNFLAASGNQITDISALASCPELYMADLGENEIKDVSPLGESDAIKMALLLQNNNIEDITPLNGLKEYVYLALYNNNITDISTMPAMTNITSYDTLYLSWWDGFDVADLVATAYNKPNLVDVPADRQVNMQNDFKDARKEDGRYATDIIFLTKAEADADIEEIRSKARETAGIKEWEDIEE